MKKSRNGNYSTSLRGGGGAISKDLIFSGKFLTPRLESSLITCSCTVNLGGKVLW